MTRILVRLTQFWDLWCCFLTDHRYPIAKEAGPRTMHQIWKYALGVMLVMGLWFFVGYFFSMQYLGLTRGKAIIGGIFMLVVIWFVERMIIHSQIKRFFSRIAIFRTVLAFLMSLVGSVILDQMLFKEDIQQARQKYIELQIQQLIPYRMQLIDEHIQQLSLQRQQIDSQIQEVTAEVRKHPTIQLPNYTQTVVRDSAGRILQRAHTAQFTAQANPELNRIPMLYRLRSQADSAISALETQKQNVADQIRQELEHSHGLLTEINAFFYFMFHTEGNRPAFFMWLIVIFVFLLIELLVLTIKILDGHNTNMYEELLAYVEDHKRRQMDKFVYVNESVNESAPHLRK
ncbi:DUF4407 domain-containing protein [Thermoflavifilum thermophilum]|uniref:DUF4407 domain-containing protein n=1 Tax=Thermoflavifilum thermophilum TaxID=1393122 RepID=A0A1I7ND66_9BACT|nr:DUF4407 domain-containing protein [Thermoflavifilum thermophilum]SFV32602.1 protein of unknown function [Thermoflavifilum thermophilum]